MADLPDALDTQEIGSFEYTFSNRELEDVLGFMERRQSGIPLEDDNTAMPLLGPSAPLSLQFQPHPLPHPSGAGTTAPLPIAPFLPGMPGFLNSGPFSMAGEDATTDPNAAHLFMVGNNGYEPTSNDGPAAYGGHAAARRGGGESSHAQGKTTVSHSTVEKQRRDRINSLIDELRDLVPSQHGAEADAAAGNDASRRPKHAVLSDTIALVKELRTKLSVVEDQMMRMHIHDAAGTFPNGNGTQAAAMKEAVMMAAATAGTAMPPLGGPSHPPEAIGVMKPPPLPQQLQQKRQQQQNMALSNGSQVAAAAASLVSNGIMAAAGDSAAAPGVTMLDGVQVDLGDGCLYVKVHCKDRHGLLADIVRTLKAIPLEITTAAITTTQKQGPEGDVAYVYDVFQVVIAPGTPTPSADHIKESVEAAMLAGTASSALGAVGKRPRRAAVS